MPQKSDAALKPRSLRHESQPWAWPTWESLHGRCFKHEYGCIFRHSLPIATTFELGRKKSSVPMSFGAILPYLLVLFLAVWTAKVAMSRGRNPWIWGGASLLLGLLPWNFLGVLPLLFMLFMPRTTIDPQTKLQRLACSKCANTHRPGQRFCTNCGWDLTEVYTPEDTEQYNIPAPMAPLVEDSIAGVETAAARSQDASAVREVEPSPIEESRPVIAQSVEAPPTAEGARPVTAQAADAADPAMAQTAEPIQAATEPGPAAGQPAEAAPVTAEPGPVMGQGAEARPADQDDGASAPAPWGVPTPGAPPTAATMTARGMRLFNDGRTQEAIDQFTKAIALDPSFPEAWERRAEAYSKQGRGEAADADRLILSGLDATSSPG